MNKKDWKYRFDNLERAYLDLINAVSRIKDTPDDDLIRAGLIQIYEFTLELAWKTLKDYFEEEGFAEISSPKKVIRLAFKEGYIQNAEAWLKAIEDRNLTAHTYDKALAKTVAASIMDEYLEIIRDLYFTLKKEVN
ncbi:MAG: nucleotidyltransferase [Proteobacteria bacterium]|jgi:nucleotidyltransferase substrate binding protein (TIGR01987 family)|nr:nucleotidyltransferase [Pseudomonadota bacterium]